MTNHHQPPMHDRQAALAHNTGHVEVMHGADAVVLIAHTDRGPTALILDVDQAHRLAKILDDQATAVVQGNGYPEHPDAVLPRR